MNRSLNLKVISSPIIKSVSNPRTFANASKSPLHVVPDRKSTKIRQKRWEKSERRYKIPQVRRKTCVICSDVVFKQIVNGYHQWYCPSCHETLSDSLVSAFNPIQAQEDRAKLRYFSNKSPHIKIVQYQDPDLGYQERVVFSGQTVLLALHDKTIVNIKSGEHVTSLEADTIRGQELPAVEVDLEEIPGQDLKNK